VGDAIKDVSKRNGIVLDPFGGSGSTLVAAHKTGRRGYLAELDPIYVDCIIRRWQAYAKDDAILAPSGETFDEIAKKRREENARIGLTAVHEIGDSQIVDHSDAPRKRHAYPRKTSPPAVQRPGDIDAKVFNDLAEKTRPAWTEIRKITDQRLGSARVTHGNVGDSPQRGNKTPETGLPGFRTSAWRNQNPYPSN
jgi:DNA methylase